MRKVHEPQVQVVLQSKACMGPLQAPALALATAYHVLLVVQADLIASRAKRAWPKWLFAQRIKSAKTGTVRVSLSLEGTACPICFAGDR